MHTHDHNKVVNVVRHDSLSLSLSLLPSNRPKNRPKNRPDLPVSADNKQRRALPEHRRPRDLPPLLLVLLIPLLLLQLRDLGQLPGHPPRRGPEARLPLVRPPVVLLDVVGVDDDWSLPKVGGGSSGGRGCPRGLPSI